MIIHLIQVNASYYKVLPKDNDVYDIVWDILSYTKPTRLMHLGGKFTYVKKSEFNKRSGSFGTGLLPFVKSKLEKQDIEYVIQPLKYDKLPMRETVSFKNIEFEDYQLRILNEVSYKNPTGQIEGPTGCLVGSTKIRLNRAARGFELSLEEIYNKQNKLNTKNYMGKKWNLNIPTYIRSFNGKTIQLNKMEKVVYSGIQKVFKLTLFNGKSIVCTKNHEIMTQRGFIKLFNLKKYMDFVMCDSIYTKSNNIKKKKFVDFYVTNLWNHPYATKTKVTKKHSPFGYTKRIPLHRAIYEAHINNLSLKEYINICRNYKIKTKTLQLVNPKIYDIHHIDFNHINNNISNLTCMKIKKHQQLHGKLKNYKNFNQGIPIYSRIKSIEYIGYEKTYDIQCTFPHNNFNANGIIVHNSGKTLIMAGIIKKYYISNTLLIVPTSDIARTTRKTLSTLLNRDIGLIGDKEKSIDTVTIGLYQSLSRIPNIKPLVNNTKLLLIDESDVATDAINTIVSQFTNTYYRYGLSATTIPISKKTIWIPGISQIGQTFVSIKDKEVEKRVTDVDAYMIKYTTIVNAKKDYQDVYRYNVLLSNTRTEKILQILQWIFEDQKRINCFIMVDELKQARLLETKIKEKYKSVVVAHGTLEKNKQEQIKEELNNGKLKICIATPVFSRGTNIPGIDSIIMASARKSLSNTKQKIGRGRRKIKGKERLLLVDIYDEVKGYEKYFEKYSKMRMNLYKHQGWWRGFL